MIGRQYLARQAMALLRFASATNDPKLAAVLVEKAALLKAQADDTLPSHDLSPMPPDVQMPSKL